MPLRFGVVLNHLTDDPDDCMAVTTDNETVDNEKIVESIIGKGSTVTKAEALSVIEEYEYAIVNAVKDGNNVITELFTITPSITGVFTSMEDNFDPARHAIKINMNAGKRLKSIVSQIERKRVEITSPQPVLKHFTDFKNNAVNESFTPGQIVSIKGSYLKFDENDQSQGIFFIDENSSETRVSMVVKNKPSELLFMVPESLTEGSFQVEVRTIFRNGTTLKKGRSLTELVPIQ
ncbi:MAG: DUF4469 domain-containing protein [Bacteroidales bacterium]|nr:DUF4469 domain-containing protein [Bacteroidales bacterium]